jgi:hypothetical protein
VAKRVAFIIGRHRVPSNWICKSGVYYHPSSLGVSFIRRVAHRDADASDRQCGL